MAEDFTMIELKNAEPTEGEMKLTRMCEDKLLESYTVRTYHTGMVEAKRDSPPELVTMFKEQLLPIAKNLLLTRDFGKFEEIVDELTATADRTPGLRKVMGNFMLTYMVNEMEDMLDAEVHGDLLCNFDRLPDGKEQAWMDIAGDRFRIQCRCSTWCTPFTSRILKDRIICRWCAIKIAFDNYMDIFNDVMEPNAT